MLIFMDTENSWGSEKYHPKPPPSSATSLVQHSTFSQGITRATFSFPSMKHENWASSCRNHTVKITPWKLSTAIPKDWQLFVHLPPENMLVFMPCQWFAAFPLPRLHPSVSPAAAVTFQLQLLHGPGWVPFPWRVWCSHPQNVTLPSWFASWLCSSGQSWKARLARNVGEPIHWQLPHTSMEKGQIWGVVHKVVGFGFTLVPLKLSGKEGGGFSSNYVYVNNLQTPPTSCSLLTLPQR